MTAADRRYRDPFRQDAYERACAALAEIDRRRFLYLRQDDAAYAALSKALDDLYGPLPPKEHDHDRHR